LRNRKKEGDAPLLVEHDEQRRRVHCTTRRPLRRFAETWV
jgi:hypothetical protein